MSFNILEFLRSLVTLTLFDYLRDVWADQMSAATIEFLLDLIGVFTVSTFLLLIVLFLIWLERKVVARIQDRVGPNRVGGRFGLLQTVADVLKLLTKESLMPAGADWLAYNLAPILTVMAALLLWAVIPFAPDVIGVDLNIGLFYVLAVSSASVVVLLLAGWGSNNKYALLGAFRAVAQLVSYEVPMVISLLIPILLARSMYMQEIVGAQTVPFFFVVPVSAIIFFVSALAETGRTPFDLLEAESEIVAGFHVEYTGMKFGMFFLAEFISTLFMSALFATVFLGGWRFFGLERMEPFGRLIGLIVFFIKMFAVYFVFIWIRGTFPRVRVDQMLDLNWKFLVPLSLLLLLVVAIVDKLIPVGAGSYYRAGVHLFTNLVIGFSALEILRRRARRDREAHELRLAEATAAREELVAERAH
ncbi:MAG TPA: NADH-quinone oxidoreductase subunit NuoH [Candidatus Sulfomarinibacteraceae bacterium]|nr:NADH-quinone oxidoreductase subunit NuoH [Candidatus Sulfomarinibacteraceae bacterium]